jgi:hypothetical protein
VTETANTANQSLTIRMAVPADCAALTRLAQLDSAAPFDTAAVLVAEVDGELVAAVPREGGEAIANPFRRTAAIVALLEGRAAELDAATRSTRRSRRLLRSLRLSLAGQA